jgi:hypothetical protein
LRPASALTPIIFNSECVGVPGTYPFASNPGFTILTAGDVWRLCVYADFGASYTLAGGGGTANTAVTLEEIPSW